MECFLGNGRVIGNLPAQPPTVAEAEVAAKPKVRVGRDCSLARNDLADSLRWYADVFCEAIPRETEWLEKLFFEHLARRDR